MNKLKSIISSYTIVYSLLLVIGFIACNENRTVKKDIDKPTVKIDKQLLQGSWVRTDAEYQIRISNVSNTGVMTAQYFNPRPINVSRSEWAYDGGFLKIYVELRDENYPGSNYNLSYIPERDMLVGDYFQAVESVTYYVEFARNN